MISTHGYYVKLTAIKDAKCGDILEPSLIIRWLREDHDKTHPEIAAVLGIEQTIYSRYERGVHPLPLRHLKKLCQYYGVSADYILGLPDNLSYPKRK